MDRQKCRLALHYRRSLLVSKSRRIRLPLIDLRPGRELCPSFLLELELMARWTIIDDPHPSTRSTHLGQDHILDHPSRPCMISNTDNLNTSNNLLDRSTNSNTGTVKLHLSNSNSKLRQPDNPSGMPTLPPSTECPKTSRVNSSSLKIHPLSSQRPFHHMGFCKLDSRTRRIDQPSDRNSWQGRREAA